MEVLLKEVFEDDFWIMPQTPQYLEAGVPYITSKNIKKGKIDFSNVNYISEEDYQVISKNRPIKEDDILISMIGTLGETAVVKLEDGKFYGQNMFLVRLDKEKVYDRYFLNYFNSNKVKRDLERSQNQSTQRYLKANHIEDLIIPLPSLGKQRFIAQTLDLLSDIIKNRQKELEELDNLIKSRFVELFGDPMINPFNFPVKTIEEVAYLNKGITYSPEDVGDDGMIVLRSSNIKGNKFDLADLVKITKIVSAEKCVQENDILMCNRNGSARLVGKVAKIPKLNENMTFGTFMTIVRSDIFEYLFVFFQLDAFREQIKFQTAVAINQISLPLLAAVKVPVPPKELIDEFTTFVTQVDKLKFEVQKSLDETQTLMDSLMQQYFG